MIVFTFALLIGLSPISNHVFAMQTVQMDGAMSSQHDDMDGGNSSGDNSSMPCCDELAQTFTGCALLVPQFDYVGLAWGSERIAGSNSAVQTIYIQTLSPPPKI